jgi:hypothetical protein
MDKKYTLRPRAGFLEEGDSKMFTRVHSTTLPLELNDAHAADF